MENNLDIVLEILFCRLINNKKKAIRNSIATGVFAPVQALYSKQINIKHPPNIRIENRKLDQAAIVNKKRMGIKKERAIPYKKNRGSSADKDWIRISMASWVETPPIKKALRGKKGTRAT